MFVTLPSTVSTAAAAGMQIRHVTVEGGPLIHVSNGSSNNGSSCADQSTRCIQSVAFNGSLHGALRVRKRIFCTILY